MLKMNSVLSVVLALCFASLAYSFEFGYEPTYNDEFAIDKSKEWEQFKIKFNKKYDSPVEEIVRRVVFYERLRKTQQHNLKFKRGEVSYTQAINKFSDMFHSEVPKGLVPVPSEALKDVQYYQSPADSSVPEEVDWRTKGVVTEVKDQKNCGSCWAFATTGVLEGQIAIKSGKLVSLSEQNLVDCDEGDGGCDGGGLPITAYQYIIANGIDSEQSYPYENDQGSCRFNNSNVVGRGKGFQRIHKSEEALKRAVATVGPISVGIHASEKFQHYHHHVFKSDDCSSDPGRSDHAVLVVGYGTTAEGEDYWIVKNSWGKHWGDKGYIRMARNYNNICGIANQASFPVV